MPTHLRIRLLLTACVIVLLAATGNLTRLCGQTPPNVLIFLVDDLGAKDLGYSGSTYYQTPSIDKLANDGWRFTNAYAAASVCSPSRAALLTGLHPVRLNITDWIPGNAGSGKPLKAPEDASELSLDAQTLGDCFSEAGYRTYYAGKWHLGGSEFAPPHQGFQTYFDPHNNPEKGQPGNRPVGNDRPHATRTMTDHLCRYLEQDSSQPFFAILSYFDVHTPIIPDQQFLNDYQVRSAELPDKAPIPEHDGLSRSQQDSPPYGSMVSAVDQSVGRVIDTLKKQNLHDSTIIVFTSDNGGLCTLKRPGPTCNLPLRSGKGWLYEGGIQVPLIVRLPQRMPRHIDSPVSLMDLFPTLLSLAGLEASSQPIDGQNLLEDSNVPRKFFWHYPHYHGSTWTPGAAIRDGQWKLIRFYETDVDELYDLEADPGEQNNLAASNPDKVAELRQKLEDWQQQQNAKLPTPREPSRNED